MSAGKASSLFSTGASLGHSPALLANIRQGWKGLAGTNTLAYYDHSSIAALKGLITLVPGLERVDLDRLKFDFEATEFLESKFESGRRKSPPARKYSLFISGALRHSTLGVGSNH
jgi:hypothetical protein